MIPPWLTAARGYLGMAEVPGPASNSRIRDLWLRLKGGAWFWRHFGGDDSRLPWCGAFVARAMQDAAMDFPDRYASALAWLSWGRTLHTPVVGCVVVFKRAGGGHVALAVGRDEQGRILCLGGNQGDRVSVAPFDEGRVLGYRWPLGYPILDEALPVTHSASPSSTQEA